MRNPGEKEARAAEYVLGLMTPEDRAAFEARLAEDDGLRRLVRRWTKTLAPLEEDGAGVAPPPRLWDRIKTEITGDGAAGADDVADAAESASAARAFDHLNLAIGSDDGAWQPLAPGISKKPLLKDPEGGWESYLLHLAPGAVLPAHPHSALEECVLLEGEIALGGALYRAGDYLALGAHTRHAPMTTASGATVFIRGEIRD